MDSTAEFAESFRLRTYPRRFHEHRSIFAVYPASILHPADFLFQNAKKNFKLKENLKFLKNIGKKHVLAKVFERPKKKRIKEIQIRPYVFWDNLLPYPSAKSRKFKK